VSSKEASAFCGGLFSLSHSREQGRLVAPGEGIVAPTQTLDVVSLEKLRETFHGQLILPGDGEYERARVVWNAIADRHPAIVARCGSADDVIAAVRFARGHDLVIAVRGGGHSVAGFSTCDGGMVIDLSGMRAVSVDPARRTARVGGGALLEQLDRAAQEYGLACPVGVVGHTGVAGLTLGGGMGRLQRKHGFTIDNLLSVDLVTADGVLRHVSDKDDPELFWGLRGAGANFGVATAFEFRLHPIGPNITTAVVVFPIDQARDAAALYRELFRSAPEYMHLGMGFSAAADGRGATPGQGGTATVGVGAAHFGPPHNAERDLGRLRGQIEPITETVTATTYLALQTMSDEEMAWGKRFYMKSGFLDELSDAAVDRATEYVSNAPGDCSISLWAQGGATRNFSEDAMAFTGRGAAFSLDAQAFHAGRPIREQRRRTRWRHRAVHLRRREVRAAAWAEASLRPRQRVPAQPEYSSIAGAPLCVKRTLRRGAS
jgi:FAD binding domain-containing protein